MKKLWLIALLFFPMISFSQYLHLNLFGGFSNYQGDLEEKQFTLDQSNGAVGIGLQYDISNHFSLRTGLMHGRVSADDKQNKPGLRIRNLSFTSAILEGNLLLEYNILNLTDRRFTPYLFGGLAIYHYDPYTYDTLGNRIYLKPLSTEGQGLDLYPDRKPYKLTQLSIPFGAGLKLRVSDKIVMGYEIGMRKLFTDYLDDVSDRYPDAAALLGAKGAKAVEMSYRGGEIKNGSTGFPVEGSVRGGAKQKDWYYFQGITLSITLPTGGFSGQRVNGSRMGCPGSVF